MISAGRQKAALAVLVLVVAAAVPALASYGEARVRYIMADISLGGPISYYRSYPNDDNAVEALRRWDDGVRVTNRSRFERHVEDGGPGIVYARTRTVIDGMDVRLTTDDTRPAYDEARVRTGGSGYTHTDDFATNTTTNYRTHCLSFGGGSATTTISHGPAAQKAYLRSEGGYADVVMEPLDAPAIQPGENFSFSYDVSVFSEYIGMPWYMGLNPVAAWVSRVRAGSR